MCNSAHLQSSPGLGIQKSTGVLDQAGVITAPVYVCRIPAQSRPQVIPEELRCSAYAFDRGIFGLLGAIAAPLVRCLPSQRISGVAPVYALYEEQNSPYALHSTQLLLEYTVASSTLRPWASLIAKLSSKHFFVVHLRQASWLSVYGVGRTSHGKRLLRHHLLKDRGKYNPFHTMTWLQAQMECAHSNEQ